MPAPAHDVGFNLGSVRVVISGEGMETLAASRRLEAVITGLAVPAGGSGLPQTTPQSRSSAGLWQPESLSVGQIILASGGGIPCPVLQVVVADPFRGVLPTERTFRQLARDSFVRCEALGHRRIGIAGMSLEAGRISAAQATRCFLESLASHVEAPTLLISVFLSLPDGASRTALLEEIQVVPGEGLVSIRRMTPSTEAGPPAPFSVLAELGRPETSASSTIDAVSTTVLVKRKRGKFPFPWIKPGRPSSRVTEPRRHLPEGQSRPGEALAPADRRLRDRRRSAGSGRLMADPKTRPFIGERYVLLEQIGRGGQGIVYLAWDVSLRRLVAIKGLRRDVVADPDAGEALRREAALSMDLSHDGILRVHHFEQNDEDLGPYLVMEYLSWSTGEKWIADSGNLGLPVPVVVEIGYQLCDALAYAHDKGVLHTDIKPGNVFVDPGAERAKLADFGLARAMGRSRGRSLSLIPSGTPAYMPPEQMRPGARLDVATDIYQLSATLWDFLTGHPPDRESMESQLGDPDRGPVLKVLRVGLEEDPKGRPRDTLHLKGLLQGAASAL